MNDIITTFPTAEQMSNGATFDLYLFEEELRTIFKSMAQAKQRLFTEIELCELSKDAMDFLNDKGYHIKNTIVNSWIVSWT